MFRYAITQLISAANDETVALNIHPFSRINRHSPI